MNKRILYPIFALCLVIVLVFVFWQIDGKSNMDDSRSDVITSANLKGNYKHIGLQDSLTQDEESYYLYFYKSDCPYCAEVEDKILQLNEKETLYVLNCDQEENRGNKYDWTNPIHDLKAIGFINEKGEKQFYDQESEEKYLNIDELNKYGNKIYYKIDTDVDEEDKEIIHAKMITPEIDYSLVEKWEDITIAGVPTLLHVSNGKIDKFYFDSPDINSMELE